MTNILKIESLDLEGKGVSHHDGKVVFVKDALPNELVEVKFTNQKKSYNNANLIRVIKESNLRVEPRCEYFGVCGGCAMQHLDASAQVAIKQRVLEDNLKHIGNVKSEQIIPPIYGTEWGYRYRARLSVKFVAKKGGVLVGFRERNSRYIADMKHCHILPKNVSDLLVPLRELIATLSCPARIPQIEVAVGDETIALVLRHLEPLTDVDKDKLKSFAQLHNTSWWLQPKGPETVHPLIEEDTDRLYYSLQQFGLTMWYRPTDFTQVNHKVNASLIAKAISLLQPKENEVVADLFCGLGNFSLPLATIAKKVIGIEGATTLTQRAQELSKKNNLDHKTSFETLNLFEIDKNWLLSLGYLDKVLIDPPRDGAHELSKAYAQLDANQRPKRIVYVSCNPATLARDAGILVNEGKYKLKAAGVVNMFAHTGHVESIAVFE